MEARPESLGADSIARARRAAQNEAAQAICARCDRHAVSDPGPLCSGIGRGHAVPNSLALLSHAYPDEKARGVPSASGRGASLALDGRSFVGAADHTGRWRSIFLSICDRSCRPLAGLGLCRRDDAIARREIDCPSDHRDRSARLAGGAIIEGGSLGWHDPFVIAGFAAFAILRAVRVGEARAPQPMLPLSLFRHRDVRIDVAVGLSSMSRSTA